ncbi:DUF982 domain-containing protein (plasmid) [Phyllobacterium sp. 628]|uniref:DUF982 domain-containing protein n=1 Tax=Phyllobacterium sp. 628 TaxID=2718938 RepID=UPI0016627991|nr:DUF982 domain-containing protein [Phyllobacterium sp. 628]
MGKPFEYVTVKSPRTGRIEVVRNIEHALALLAEHWFKHCSEKHGVACAACRSAIAGKTSVLKARAVFVEAAEEVHILVYERVRSWSTLRSNI